MRQYKYQAIVRFKDDGSSILLEQRAENKPDAREKFHAFLGSCGVKRAEYEIAEINRVNITEQRRYPLRESLAFVDMGQCAI